MSKKISDIVWGIVLIVVGIIFLGNEFDFWNIKLFFEGWWTFVIIIPSALTLCSKGGKISGSLGLLLGILLLMASRDIIKWSSVGKIFLPSLLIIIGFSVIFKKNLRTTKVTNKNGINKYSAVFAGSEEIVSNQEFFGANITAIFGGVELDLRNAIIKEDIVINCNTIFGGIDLILPDNVKIKTSGVPVFGGIENKKENCKAENAPTIYINYVCVFAGVDLK